MHCTVSHTWRLALSFISVGTVSTLCASPLYNLESHAFGNQPSQVFDSKVYNRTEWLALGQKGSASASAPADSWDPPFSETKASISFDQSQPEDGILKASALLRQPYRGRYKNQVEASTEVTLLYDLEIENLSSASRTISFGNMLHGTIGADDGGFVTIDERTNIPGVTSGVLKGRIDFNKSSYSASGLLNGFAQDTTVGDVVYTNAPGKTITTLEVYGQLLFAPGEKKTLSVSTFFKFSAYLDEPFTGSGFALADFANTGHLLVRAYDPNTGNETPSDLSVKLAVPEPGSILAMGVATALLLKRRRLA